MNIVIVATLDTKRDSAALLANTLIKDGHSVSVLNTGSLPYQPMPGLTVIEVFTEAQKKAYQLSITHREPDQTQAAVERCKVLGKERILQMYGTHTFDAVVGIGGGNGTVVAQTLMQALPAEVKKCCVSTLAPNSFNDGISYIPALTDLLGMNRILKAVLTYTAKWVVDKMDIMHPERAASSAEDGTELALDFLTQIMSSEKLGKNASKTVAITMFGNTTPCAEACFAQLVRKGYEVLGFHATGVGDGVMRWLVENDCVAAVLDLTTTALADLKYGGALAATEERYYSIGEKKLPHVIVPGCLDMINYPKGAVPAERAQNPKYDWGPFTLSRTTVADNKEMGKFLAHVANLSNGKVVVCLPRYFSKLDQPGSALYLEGANEAFRDTLKAALKPSISCIESNDVINAKVFSNLLVDQLLEMMPARKEQLFLLKYSAQPDRRQILIQMRHKIEKGEMIIGSGAGNGLNAKAQVAGGTDIIIVYNSGYFRTHGHGSLAGLMPFDNANETTFDIGRFILRQSSGKPVMAGLCAQDPGATLKELVQRTKREGYSGIQNFPTVGLIDGMHRQHLEATGMGYDKEVELVRLANQAGLLTTPYVFNVKEAEAMTAAGADILVLHFGLTISSGNCGGADTRITTSMDDSVALAKEVVKKARAINPDVIILIHGGIFDSAESYVALSTKVAGINGFYGASPFEREPAYSAIAGTVSDFRKRAKL